MEKGKKHLIEIGEFIAKYASAMMGYGIHTSRVIRCATRIGEAFGCTTNIAILQRSIILTLQNKDSNIHYNEVINVPTLPISFSLNSALSELSWDIHDNKLSLHEAKTKYEDIISVPRMKAKLVLLLVSLANASFCRLFGGDWISMIIVFFATAGGFFLRQTLTKAGLNHFIIVVSSAFLASFIASSSLIFNTTSDIAMATSVLYLVPGVPLLNGVIDVVEGHTLTGLARLIQAILLIICIAVGMSITLMIFKARLI